MSFNLAGVLLELNRLQSPRNAAPNRSIHYPPSAAHPRRFARVIVLSDVDCRSRALMVWFPVPRDLHHHHRIDSIFAIEKPKQTVQKEKPTETEISSLNKNNIFYFKINVEMP